MADELTDFIGALRDPYWLVREYQRIDRLHTAHYQRQTDEHLALCKRVGEQLDSVQMLKLPVLEG